MEALGWTVHVKRMQPLSGGEVEPSVMLAVHLRNEYI